MPLHCASKTILSEMSMSDDYLRWENLPGPGRFDQSNLPRGREFDHKIGPEGLDFTGF